MLRLSGRLGLMEWVPREEELGPKLEERVAESDVAAALATEGVRSFTEQP